MSETGVVFGVSIYSRTSKKRRKVVAEWDDCPKEVWNAALRMILTKALGVDEGMHLPSGLRTSSEE